MNKNLLLCALLCLVSIIAYAQDIIITIDAKKIEAKIMEVSKSEIKYKEPDNLDGPMFILEVDEINSIIYSTGKVVLYNQPAQSTTPPIEQPVQNSAVPIQQNNLANPNLSTVLLLSGEKMLVEVIDMNNNYVSYLEGIERKNIPASQIHTVTLPNGQVKTYNKENPSSPSLSQTQTQVQTQIQTTTVGNDSSSKKAGRIYRDNKNYLYNDMYISSKEVERILMRENGAAYNKWKQAKGMLIGGSVCTGLGTGLVIGGLFSLLSDDNIICISLESAALIPLGIGLGLTLGSSAYFNKAIDIYNSKYDNVAVQLRWGVTANGVGLAIAF